MYLSKVDLPLCSDHVLLDFFAFAQDFFVFACLVSLLRIFFFFLPYSIILATISLVSMFLKHFIKLKLTSQV